MSQELIADKFPHAKKIAKTITFHIDKKSPMRFVAEVEFMDGDKYRKAIELDHRIVSPQRILMDALAHRVHEMNTSPQLSDATEQTEGWHGNPDRPSSYSDQTVDDTGNYKETP